MIPQTTYTANFFSNSIGSLFHRWHMFWLKKLNQKNRGNLKIITTECKLRASASRALFPSCRVKRIVNLWRLETATFMSLNKWIQDKSSSGSLCYVWMVCIDASCTTESRSQPRSKNLARHQTCIYYHYMPSTVLDWLKWCEKNAK
jgi:hypothetical protein